jgi:hypothetical protein
MNKITIHSSAEVMADPHALLRELREAIPDFDAAAAAAVADAAAEEEMLSEMASYGSDDTGVSNSIFISTKTGVRHGPRVKVAIDPPDSFSPGGKNATVTFDGKAIGEVPAGLLWQVQQFISLNRKVLDEYWNEQISTGELSRRLQKIS